MKSVFDRPTTVSCATFSTLPVRKAHLMLLLAALLWGSGNVANKTLLAHIDPYTAVALRCLLATVVIAPFIARESRPTRGCAWLPGAFGVSLLFAAGLVLQQVAYQTTTVTNVSFLVNTAGILTPIIGWVVLRHKPSLRILFAGSLTLAGAFAMSGMTATTARINIGDASCLASALFYAGWMVALGQHAAVHGRALATSAVQFLVTALLMLPVIYLSQSPSLSGIVVALPELVFLGVFSTAAAFALQTTAQRSTTASTAAVLVSAESMFGALGAYLVLQERVSAQGAFGALLILGAILLVATAPMAAPLRSAPRPAAVTRGAGARPLILWHPINATADVPQRRGQGLARTAPDAAVVQPVRMAQGRHEMGGTG